MHWHITQPSLVQGGGEMDTLRKKWHITKMVMHYKKTGAHNPQTGTRNPKQEPA